MKTGLAAAAALLASLAAMPASADDTPSTWSKARVYLPNTSEPTTVDRIPADRKFPTAIYAHGCSGLSGPEPERTENETWAKLLAAQGLLVVMPDSLARGDRRPSCDLEKSRTGLFPRVHDMRVAEIRHATEQVRAAPWFDGKHLFLMGYSEGAVAVARTPLAGYTGLVIASWTCTNVKYKPFDGLAAPRDTPVLAVSYAEDTWYPKTSPSFGNCKDVAASRPRSQYVAIPGSGHGTAGEQAARSAVSAFVAGLVAKP